MYEPYQWLEAVCNRREYIVTTGSPVIGLTYDDGILLLTIGREKFLKSMTALPFLPLAIQRTLRN